MFTDISSATLRKMVQLSERKEALLAQIQELDREMARLQRPAQVPSTKTTSGPSATSTPRRKGKGKRGALKSGILKALQGAGNSGITVRDLAARLNVKPANLYVWFNGTGKRTAGVQKVGPAKYRLKS